MDYLGWQENGACITYNANWWVEPTASGRWHSRDHIVAKGICANCAVKADCLSYALKQESSERRFRHGIWGGTTPEERHLLTKGLLV